MRECLTRIISEIVAPTELSSYECMKVLADILRFTMTLFVHEQSTDFKLLYQVLMCSHLVYHKAATNRKVYLS